jgi:uncharacterized membrane protein
MKTPLENRHKVSVRCPFQVVVPELITWGEASWWPKRSLMKFKRLTSGCVQRGTRYRQQVLLPGAPSWEAEVVDIGRMGIARRFQKGMFEGSETVTARPVEGEGALVEYRMSYQVKGWFNRLMWVLLFRRLHDHNIEEILLHLKIHVETL